MNKHSRKWLATTIAVVLLALFNQAQSQAQTNVKLQSVRPAAGQKPNAISNSS